MTMNAAHYSKIANAGIRKHWCVSDRTKKLRKQCSKFCIIYS